MQPVIEINHLLKKLSKEAWTFLCFTVLSALVLLNFVNLEPRVDNNFFFSGNDPQFQNENLISHIFARKDTLLIISATGPVESQEYMQKINDLSESLLRLEGITGVKSISHGPNNLEDALRSPLWKRLLISKDQQSTNVIILLQDSFAYTAIPQVEKIIAQFSSSGFHLVMSGIPYIVELISRHLVKDIKIFSLLSFTIFGVVILLIFKSRGILLGTMVSCLNASMWTLMLAHLLGIKIGLLTANLATIVFVLTLSHIVFLTYNWKYVCSQQLHSSHVEEAIRLTISPSFWSMFTTLLGFLSLLSVAAQPLRELGAAGAAGSLVAMGVAYSIYPAFLRLVHPSTSKRNPLDRYQEKVAQFLEHKKKLIIKSILGLCLVAVPGLWMTNTDPSLISYFAKGSEIERGLSYIDRNGGSNPLILVIKTASGEKLNTDHAYHQLWELQKSLEQNEAVGTIISLPVLMAEAKRAPFAFFIAWEWLLDILEQPQFDEIAKSFVTEDRKTGLFLIRMSESNRKVSRLEIIERIKQVVYAHGFIPEFVGGMYSLQGHLAKLVASSVIFGLGQLIAIFALIAWGISRSLRIALAITLSIGVIPLIVLGAVGWLHVPLDIISAPASNLAVGLGIDSMIHMVKAYRRQRQQKKNSVEAWQDVKNRFWQPVLTSALVIVLGFGIFMFSEFPSTQRFGSAIVFGTLIASLTALYLMPALAQIQLKRFSPNLRILSRKS